MEDTGGGSSEPTLDHADVVVAVAGACGQLKLRQFAAFAEELDPLADGDARSHRVSVPADRDGDSYKLYGSRRKLRRSDFTVWRPGQTVRVRTPAFTASSTPMEDIVAIPISGGPEVDSCQVAITAEDIRTSARRDPRSCAVAVAIHRRLGVGAM